MIEDYGRFLKKKGKSILSEERVARRAVHHVDAGRHRHARDHPQLARRQDLRAPVPEDLRAKWARWW